MRQNVRLRKQIITNATCQFLKNSLQQFHNKFNGFLISKDNRKQRLVYFQSIVFLLVSYCNSIKKSKIKAKLKIRSGVHVERIEFGYLHLNLGSSNHQAISSETFTCEKKFYINVSSFVELLLKIPGSITNRFKFFKKILLVALCGRNNE